MSLGVFQIGSADASLSGITFSSEPGVLYVSVRDYGKVTGLEVGYDEAKNQVLLAGKPVKSVKRLRGSDSMVKVSDLKDHGATLDWDAATKTVTVRFADKAWPVTRGAKRVVVDKAKQTLTAYQGEAVVMHTNISTGRPGHGTPNGNFVAGPVKERMHYSRLYDDAPMPFSVQVAGDVFIHGYGSVPPYPASHGCVRMPLTQGNPAKQFYEWVDIGTPVTIQGDWTWPARESRKRKRRSYARNKVKSVRVPKAAAPAIAQVPPAPAEGPQAVPLTPTNP